MKASHLEVVRQLAGREGIAGLPTQVLLTYFFCYTTS
jgi:hypothetical protein